MSGELQPEEIRDIGQLIARLENMETPPLPEYLQAENLAPAIARGLSHEEHRAEWEAEHGPIPRQNDSGLPPAANNQTGLDK